MFFEAIAIIVAIWIAAGYIVESISEIADELRKKSK